MGATAVVAIEAAVPAVARTPPLPSLAGAGAKALELGFTMLMIGLPAGVDV